MHDVEALLREYDRARAYTDELWKDLSPDEVTWRPHENSSAIGWHLGHQATSLTS
jgi:DinB superfamily